MKDLGLSKFSLSMVPIAIGLMISGCMYQMDFNASLYKIHKGLCHPKKFNIRGNYKDALKSNFLTNDLVRFFSSLKLLDYVMLNLNNSVA